MLGGGLVGKGARAEVGAERVAQNGYHYVKCEGGWRLKHHLVAEKMLGRPLKLEERVHFIGSKTDFSPKNIRIVEKGKSSAKRRLAVVEARIEELQAERAELLSEIASTSTVNG